MNHTQPERDLALPAADGDTGWWDEHGKPSPWPEDFWQADGANTPHGQLTGANPKEEPAPTIMPDDHDF